jgi:hypothetical protein
MRPIDLTERSRFAVSFFSISLIAFAAWHLRGIHNSGVVAVDSLAAIQTDLGVIKKEIQEARTLIHGHDIRIHNLEEWRRAELSQRAR